MAASTTSSRKADDEEQQEKDSAASQDNDAQEAAGSGVVDEAGYDNDSFETFETLEVCVLLSLGLVNVCLLT